MQLQHEWSGQCPYCGEIIDILIDPSLDYQEYVEDCRVCCQPILLRIKMRDGIVEEVTLDREND